MAPVLMELKENGIDCLVCITAQHREMLDQVLHFFEIVPDYDLDLMKPDQSLNQLSSNILKKIDNVLLEVKPDIVLVQGDTTTAVMITLASFHQGIKVGHIEAGLRTYNKEAPYPEEINRQIISRIADFHFVPTITAQSNLLKEFISEDLIFITGNTVVDALIWGVEKMKNKPESEEIKNIKNKLNQAKKKILVTGHRRENFGKGIEDICMALIELVRKREDVQIIYPVHLNPHVNEPVFRLLRNQEDIILIPPVTYPTMLWLMKLCDLIISDSGGIQEEAPTFKKPVLVTRQVSERMESVKCGFSILVGTEAKMILMHVNQILDNPHDLIKISNPYGDGLASSRIVKILHKHLK